MNNDDLENQEIEDEAAQEIDEEAEKANIPQENPAEMVFDTVGKTAIATGSKKAINMLLKKKILLVSIIVGIALLFIILILGLFTTTKSTDFIYIEPKCTTVTVHYDPYGDEEDRTVKMELEDYVKSAVYAYTKDMTNIPTSAYHLYYALDIALRNEVITNNCEITYRDKVLETSIPADYTRDYAIENAEGITVVDSNENFIPIKVSDFCWSSFTEPEYSLYQVKELKVTSSFTDTYLNNDVYRDCQCNQYTEIETVDEDDGDKCWTYWPTDWDDQGNVIEYEREYLHQDDETGFNVYGAYYLLVQHGRLENQILSYFFGSDYLYRTTIDEDEEEDTSDNSILAGNLNSYCTTSSATANFMTYLNTFEGSGNSCDNGNGYLAENLGDGTITVGHGVTNYLISTNYAKEYIDQNNWGQYFNNNNGVYSVSHGQCLPISVVDKLKYYSIEANYAATIDTYAAQYGVTLSQFQRDAITSFNYNVGPNHTEQIIKAYAEGGYEGFWNSIKGYVNSQGRQLDGLKKRRKAEFALFVTGDYTDQGLFYSRGLDNYDYFDSEGVMARRALCSTISASGFALPLSVSTGFRCSSPFGYRIAPTAGASSYHGGLDMTVDGGTPILASKAGTVIETLNNVSGSWPSSGNYVKLQHADGTQTAYLHMLIGSVAVSVGDEVEQGQKLGEVGSTGASTGNHLHFTIYDASGNKVDPYDYLDLSGIQNPDACHY